MYITWVTGVAMLSAVAPQAPSNNLTSQVCPCLAMPQQSLTFLLTGKAGSLCTLLVLLDSFIAAMEEVSGPPGSRRGYPLSPCLP